MSCQSDISTPALKECCIDPEALPLVRLVNDLGYRTIWSCAGIGESRRACSDHKPEDIALEEGEEIVVENGISYVKRNNHFFHSCPYLVFETPPFLLAGLKRILTTMRQYEVEPCVYSDRVPLYHVPSRRDNTQKIGLSPELQILPSLIEDMKIEGSLEQCEEYKRLWLSVTYDFFNSLNEPTQEDDSELNAGG